MLSMSLPRRLRSAAPPFHRRAAPPIGLGITSSVSVAHWSSSGAKPASPYSSNSKNINSSGNSFKASNASNFSKPPPRLSAARHDAGAGAHTHASAVAAKWGDGRTPGAAGFGAGAGAAGASSSSSASTLPTGADLLLPPSVSLDALPHDLRARIASVQEKAGFVPNIFLALAHRPAEFRAFFDYHDALMTSDESQLRCGA
jgi:hypothetical protein